MTSHIVYVRHNINAVKKSNKRSDNSKDILFIFIKYIYYLTRFYLILCEIFII